MPTAYIYRGTFQVRAGETLRYIEVAADGTLGPEVSKTYAELAGIGSLSVPAVSLIPVVSAPTLSGVQIGAISAASVSLRPVVSPAAVSGVQAGSVAAVAVSLRPTVAVPSLVGVTVGSVNAAPVSVQPLVAAPSLAGVQVGSIGTAAVSLQPTVAVGTLTGVEAAAVTSYTFDSGDEGFALAGGMAWIADEGRSGGCLKGTTVYTEVDDGEGGYIETTVSAGATKTFTNTTTLQNGNTFKLYIKSTGAGGTCNIFISDGTNVRSNGAGLSYSYTQNGNYVEVVCTVTGSGTPSSTRNIGVNLGTAFPDTTWWVDDITVPVGWS